MSRRILICGSRDWIDIGPIARVLLGAKARFKEVTVVHGGARGADESAAQVCRSHGFEEEAHFADWKGKGRAAGPIRNREMLDSGVHEVWAFKDGFDWTLRTGGTENMVRIARDAGIPTYVVSRVWAGRESNPQLGDYESLPLTIEVPAP